MDSVRRHLVRATWLAMIALVWGAIAPTVFAAARQSDPIAFGEICGSTARAAAAATLGGEGSKAPAGGASAGCAFCLLGTGTLAGPCAPVPGLTPPQAYLRLPVAETTFEPLATERSQARSRAPPPRII